MFTKISHMILAYLFCVRFFCLSSNLWCHLILHHEKFQTSYCKLVKAVLKLLSKWSSFVSPLKSYQKTKSLNQPWQTQAAQCEWTLTPWFCRQMFDSPSCPRLAVDLEQTERKKLLGSSWYPGEEFQLVVFVFSVSFWLCIPVINIIKI